jgi:hypothetical protein
MSAGPNSIPVYVLKVNADSFVEKIISGATFLPYARRDAYAIKTAHCLRWQSDAGEA